MIPHGKSRPHRATRSGHLGGDDELVGLNRRNRGTCCRVMLNLDKSKRPLSIRQHQCVSARAGGSAACRVGRGTARSFSQGESRRWVVVQSGVVGSWTVGSAVIERLVG